MSHKCLKNHHFATKFSKFSEEGSLKEDFWIVHDKKGPNNPTGGTGFRILTVGMGLFFVVDGQSGVEEGGGHSVPVLDGGEHGGVNLRGRELWLNFTQSMEVRVQVYTISHKTENKPMQSNKTHSNKQRLIYKGDRRTFCGYLL